MRAVEARQGVIDILARALEVEYQIIIHSPRVAKMMPDKQLELKVELLGQDSIRHADIVAATITKLGSIPPFPSFTPLPEPLNLKDFFKKQLVLEKLALDLHSQAAESVGDDLAPSLRQLAEQERWHIRIVEEILSRI